MRKHEHRYARGLRRIEAADRHVERDAATLHAERAW
jgi:hypothetical protein